MYSHFQDPSKTHMKLVYVGTGTEWYLLFPSPTYHPEAWKKLPGFVYFLFTIPTDPDLSFSSSHGSDWPPSLPCNLPLQSHHIVILFGSINITSNPSTLKRQHVLLKHQYSPTRLHDITIPKAKVWTICTVETSKLILFLLIQWHYHHKVSENLGTSKF